MRIQDRQHTAFTVCVLLACSLALNVHSQVSPLALLSPWPEAGMRTGANSEFLFFVEEKTRKYHEKVESFRLSWSVWKRVSLRKDTEKRPYLVLPVELTFLNCDSQNKVIGGQFNHFSLGLGSTFDVGSDLTLDILGGGGTANDGHFSVKPACYGIGAASLGLSLGEHSSVGGGITYNGHRALWPDVPLPSVRYCYNASEDCRLAVGFPDSRFFLRVLGRYSLQAQYMFPASVDIVARYKFHGPFLHYRHALEGFWLGPGNRRRLDLGDKRRLFHEFHSLGIGMRIPIFRHGDLVLGGGCILDRRFSTGWDLRDLTEYRKLKPTWFFTAGAVGRPRRHRPQKPVHFEDEEEKTPK